MIADGLEVAAIRWRRASPSVERAGAVYRIVPSNG
jgi:hypothetical protein